MNYEDNLMVCFSLREGSLGGGRVPPELRHGGEGESSRTGGAVMVATLNGLAVDEDPPRWSVDDSLQAAAVSGPQYRAALYLLARSPVFRAPPETGVERYLPESGGINVPKLSRSARRAWLC